MSYIWNYIPIPREECYICRQHVDDPFMYFECVGPFKSYLEADKYSDTWKDKRQVQRSTLISTQNYFPGFLKKLHLIWKFHPQIKLKTPEQPQPINE